MRQPSSHWNAQTDNILFLTDINLQYQIICWMYFISSRQPFCTFMSNFCLPLEVYYRSSSSFSWRKVESVKLSSQHKGGSASFVSYLSLLHIWLYVLIFFFKIILQENIFYPVIPEIRQKHLVKYWWTGDHDFEMLHFVLSCNSCTRALTSA